MKNVILTIAKYGISFGILAFLFYQAQQSDQFGNFLETRKNYGWLLFALLVGLVTALISFFRWYLLVRALNLDFKLRDAIRLGFLGHLLNLMSVGVLGGDALKSVFLMRQLPGRGPEALASVIFDRAIGMLAMFTMASLAYLFVDFTETGLLHENENYRFHLVCRTTIGLTLIGYGGLGVLFLVPRFTKSSIYRYLGGIPKVGGLFQRLVAVVLTYRYRFPAVIMAFLLSMLINVLFALTFFSIASGLSDSHPTFAQHLVISPIAMVANAVPLPGGLGGMESAMHYMYRAVSSTEEPFENGLIVALGFRLILLVTAGIGLIYYFTSKREINELTAAEPGKGAPTNECIQTS